MTNIMKSTILLAICLPIAMPADDDAIIFEEEPAVAPSELDSEGDEVISLRQNLSPTFRQPGLRENSRCRDAKLANGFCVTLKQCPPLLRIALNPNSPDYPFLQYSICGNFGGSQYFCCKNGQVSSPQRPLASNSRPTTKQPSPRPSATCETSANINFAKCGKSKTLGNRVIGGRAAEKSSSPWIVLVLKDSIGVCGASLITNQHALSAAHCFTESATEVATEKEIMLRIAEHDTTTVTDGKHYDMEVANIKVHEKYSLTDFRNDIAIIKMKRQICFSTRATPVCVPDKTWNFKRLEDYKGIVVGWGFVNPLGFAATVLQQAELTIYNTDQCRANYSITFRRQAGAIDETTICSGDSAGKKDSCSGDSGGPLVVSDSGKYYLIGVVSRGPKYCGTPGLPGIYTRVSMYYDWILRNIT